ELERHFHRRMRRPPLVPATKNILPQQAGSDWVQLSRPPGGTSVWSARLHRIGSEHCEHLQTPRDTEIDVRRTGRRTDANGAKSFAAARTRGHAALREEPDARRNRATGEGIHPSAVRSRQASSVSCQAAAVRRTTPCTRDHGPPCDHGWMVVAAVLGRACNALCEQADWHTSPIA